MRKMHSIFGALPIVAASYGDDMGVKVVIAGSEAFTDGETIHVPNLDIQSDKRLEDVLWGYLSHEAAHIKHTDFDRYDLDGLPPLGKSLANLIEDVWIENALIKDLPGTRFTMDKTLDFVMSKGNESESEIESEPNPADILHKYLWVWLRCVYREQKSLQNELDKARRLFDNTFPRSFCNDLEDLIRQRMSDINSTAKANKLTRDVIDLVEKHIPPEEPEEPEEQQDQKPDQSEAGDQSGQGQGDSQQSEDGHSQSSESDASGDDEGQGDSSADSNGGDESQNQDSGKADPDSGSNSQSVDDQDEGNTGLSDGSGQQSDNSDQSQNNQASTSSGAGNQNKKNACKDALNAGIEDIGKDLGELLKAILNAHSDSSGQQLPKMSYDKQQVAIGRANEIQDGVLHASKLRAKLTGLVQSQGLRRNYETNSGRAINTRRLDRLRSGDLRVFSHESPRKMANADVCLLLDSSSSMRVNNRSRVCNSATASLALALSDTKGVDVCAGTFPGYESAVAPINHMGQPIRKNLGRFQINPHGGTPLAEALLWSVKELRRGKREKKIVMVLSDGEPFDSHIVKRIIADMEDTGIQLIGVGIQLPAIADYFKKAVVINDLNDLGPKLFEIAREVL